MGWILPVNVTSVAYLEYCQRSFIVVNFINYSVIPGSQSPTLTAGQLEAPGWPGTFGQATNCVTNTTEWAGRKIRQLFLGAGQYEDRIAHLRSRSISLIARSKGIGLSWEAFAASKARMDSNSSRSARSFWYAS